MPETVLHLSRSLEDPARARAFVADRLHGFSLDTCGHAKLLVSELVSNVVRHGALPARMTVHVGDEIMHVVVADSGPALPDRPWVSDLLATSGRGLLIVSAIALDWGVITSADKVGKEIWFDLELVRT